MSLQSCHKIHLSWLAGWFPFRAPFLFLWLTSLVVHRICQNSLGCRWQRHNLHWFKQKENWSTCICALSAQPSTGRGWDGPSASLSYRVNVCLLICLLLGIRQISWWVLQSFDLRTSRVSKLSIRRNKWQKEKAFPCFPRWEEANHPSTLHQTSCWTSVR